MKYRIWVSKLDKSSSQGFTFIEVLVAIAILAVVSVIAMTFFGNAQASARDSKRISEIESISNVLEVNKSPSGYLPLSPNMFSTLVFPGGITSEALDPQGYPYCISSGSTPTPLPDNLSGVSGWVNLTGAADCPATPAGWSKISGSTPPDPTMSWTICTRLENKGSPSAFCRSNTQ